MQGCSWTGGLVNPGTVGAATYPLSFFMTLLTILGDFPKFFNCNLNTTSNHQMKDTANTNNCNLHIHSPL
jgi:hypothetical protein